MRDRIRATDTPAPLTDTTRLLLGRLADTLQTQRANAPMHEAIRAARCLVLAEQLLGDTEEAYDAEQDLLAAAPPVGPDQTRGQYAATLRLIAAQGVSAE
ncbi:hypothetical protein ACIO3R_01530 [Streptomyces sp. NPDC087428]|uniref:hypothetical protein n=1 Tax=Streptomyces sp. NPDC087428 TaxID=3365788 RepID=UPI0038156A89